MKSKELPKVLIVDDDPIFREAYTAYFSRDFQVHSASDGDDAIHKLKKYYPDAILLDLRMPQVSGIDVLQYMKLWPRMRNIPVIVVTSQRVDGKIRQELDPLPNVCEAFEKTTSPKKILAEAVRMTGVGELYRETPELFVRLRQMREESERRTTSR